MDRPYVVCHMLSSLDGKISGAFMESPLNKPAVRAYGRLRASLDCTATLYGTTTMAESFAHGYVHELPRTQQRFSTEDYSAQSDAQSYIVSLDPAGQLAWKGKYLERKGRPKAHIIEVLLESVTQDYLAYLRSMDISYLFAGVNRLDCALMLHKLRTIFGIERLMVAGGGIMNGSLFRCGLIDELSIVLSPLIEGRTKEASLVEYTGQKAPLPAVAFSLEAAEKMEDVLWLRYKTNRHDAGCNPSKAL